MSDSPPRRSGLGRGLQALLPDAGEHPPAPDTTDWLAASDDDTLPARLPAVVDAGLDVLERTLGLDVCAYVHAREQGRPRLWLRDRPGGPLQSRDWFELGLSAVGLLGQVRVPRTVEVAGTELLAVPTRSAVSAGVHLLGRYGQPLSDHERTVAIHLVQALGEAVHGLVPELEHEGGAHIPPIPPASAPEPLAGQDRPAPMAVTAQWPPIDIEELVRDTVRASGVTHSELAVHLTGENGADVLDVAAAHRGDRVRVVLPANRGDPADTATQAALQTVNLLQLIGADGVPPLELLTAEPA